MNAVPSTLAAATRMSKYQKLFLDSASAKKQLPIEVKEKIGEHLELEMSDKPFGDHDLEPVFTSFQDSDQLTTLMELTSKTFNSSII